MLSPSGLLLANCELRVYALPKKGGILMANARVISFHYTLTDSSGETLDSSAGQEPLAFIEGLGQIIPGLESTLVTLARGDKRQVQVKADQAYGPRDPERMISVPRSQFPNQEISIGDMFQAGEDAELPPLVVVDINAETVVLDANHPLAGQDLTFDVEIVDVRTATAEELSHGHVHGAGGHHH